MKHAVATVQQTGSRILVQVLHLCHCNGAVVWHLHGRGTHPRDVLAQTWLPHPAAGMEAIQSHNVCTFSISSHQRVVSMIHR